MVLQTIPIGTSCASEVILFWVLKYCKFYLSESPNQDNLFEIPEIYSPRKYANDLENL